MKAMVLAAGLGTRLAPLTEELPKVLFPVVGIPLVGASLQLAKRFGATEAVLNLHHLGPMVQKAIGEGEAWGMELHYSAEDQILGTGGGVKQAQDLLADPEDDSFLLLNGDILADLDLAGAIAEHRASGATATMVLTPAPDATAPGEGLVGVDAEGRIQRISHKLTTKRDVERWGWFTGIHVLRQRSFEYMPPFIHFDINAYLYPKLLENDESIRAHFVDGFWADLGTFARYHRIVTGLLAGRVRCEKVDVFAALVERRDLGERVFVAPEAEIDPKAKIVGPCAIAAGAKVGPLATVGPESVVAGGAVIAQGCQVVRSIVLPEVRLKPGEALERVVASSKHRVRVAEGG